MNQVKITIAWFTSEQWPEVQRIMADKATESYKQWLRHARELETRLTKEGIDFARHPMDLADFQFWCKRKGRKLDAASRAAYVADKTRK
jgi:polyphosphate kinase 2 (PPK2 family)